jgi:hypothetical protein
MAFIKGKYNNINKTGIVSADKTIIFTKIITFLHH